MMGQSLSIIDLNAQGLNELAAPEIEMEQRPQSNVAIIGILVTILIFLLVQTAAISYWAGQQSSKQESSQTQLNELRQKYEITQAQFQVIANKLSALEALMNASDKKRER